MRFFRTLLPISLILGFILSGCATTQATRPDDALTRAEYAISQAEEAVANPSQSVPLYEAKEKLRRARSLVSQDEPSETDVTRAKQLAEEVVLDANAAEAEARQEQANSRVADLEDNLETLRNEIERAQGGQQ